MRAASATPGYTSSLRPMSAAILFVLVAQFMLGMAVNLYGQIPATHPGRDATEYFGGVATGVTWAIGQGPFWLRLHAFLGVLLVLAALWLLVLAIQARVRRWIVVSVLGLVGILAAGFNGASFLNYGHDFSSMLMSTGFALAVSAYVAALLSDA